MQFVFNNQYSFGGAHSALNFLLEAVYLACITPLIC
jgi:hypothetical protein